MMSEGVVMGPLMQRAEQLIGSKQFDPLLLLALEIDDDALTKHTIFGGKLLKAVETLLLEKESNRDALLQEAKTFARESLHMELEWRLGCNHMPAGIQYRARKNELLCNENASCRDALAPTLLQIVSR